MEEIKYTEAKSLRDVKVGDYVVVVYQRTLQQIRSGEPTGWFPAKIEKKGRKYYYIKRDKTWMPPMPFDPGTGESHHKDYITRSNGYGFDVYLSLDHFKEVDEQRKELARLRERIYTKQYSFLAGADRSIVREMHRLLDLVEQGKKLEC